MQPLGYVVMQPGLKENKPVKAWQKWMDRIPQVYRESVLGIKSEEIASSPELDNELAVLRHYRSLMPMAMDARKPMFFLKPADGAIGAHSYAVTACYQDFLKLAKTIGQKIRERETVCRDFGGCVR